MKAFVGNILTRLSLIRTALTRRFIYDDICRLARSYGLEYRDIKADLEPFEFLAEKSGSSSLPDFEFLRNEVSRFTPVGAPAFFNSERAVGVFLGCLILQRGYSVVVELGCFAGFTSAHLSHALQKNRTKPQLWCVDYRQDYLDATHANLKRHQLEPHVRFLRGMSLDPHVLVALPQTMDLVFLDTSHGYPETRDEIMTYASRLAPGGCLVLHDSISAPGVRRALLETASHFRSFTFATEYSNGITVLQPIRKDE